ncbi:AI-2E family transporter [Aneurinibacillus sp. Ricciae_BoGa-3]|uniref:AI-2E family transporter n=1 Tax=Aneurinibacillus sp. Ricciae_BoGa-3 TaxID=3022697 RepID=UPI00234257CC|nr:AI-2E family transporter [Aneurinibacillus sp. Ricciae_BoGa-3]WCK56540.1 AI-2E family transporter [Aneurinibacillus sp. Ricciae_BoGa-3]
MNKEITSIFKTLIELYRRYFYLFARPLAVLLAFVLFVKIVVYVAINTLQIFHVFLWLTLPFLIGMGISMALEPLNKYVHEKWRMPRVLAVTLNLLMMLLILFGIIFLLLYAAVVQAEAITVHIIRYIESLSIENSQRSLLNFFQNSLIARYISFEQLNSLITQYQDNLIGLLNRVKDTLGALGRRITSSTTHFFIKVVPTVFATMFIAFFASFFISKDKNKINRLIVEYVPTKWYRLLIRLKDEVVRNAFNYIKSQLILITVSGIFLLIGFLIVRSPYAIALGLIGAILNLIPMGALLIILPMAIYYFVVGNMFGVYTVIIAFIVSLAVKHVIEPKVMGDTLGFHPLLLIFAFYVGVELFGGIGIIAGPFLLIFIKILFDMDIIRIKKAHEVE